MQSVTVCNVAPNTAAHTANQAVVSVSHYILCVFFHSFFCFLRLGSTPNNLANPITVPRVFSSGCHDNCEFYFWLLLKWCVIRDPKCYVRRCALFQTGVSCCTELKVINYRGMVDSQEALALSLHSPYSSYHIVVRGGLSLLCRKDDQRCFLKTSKTCAYFRCRLESQ